MSIDRDAYLAQCRRYRREGKNLIGLTIDAYKCKRCGYLHANLFQSSITPVRCHRCRKPMALPEQPASIE